MQLRGCGKNGGGRQWGHLILWGIRDEKVGSFQCTKQGRDPLVMCLPFYSSHTRLSDGNRKSPLSHRNNLSIFTPLISRREDGKQNHDWRKSIACFAEECMFGEKLWNSLGAVDSPRRREKGRETRIKYRITKHMKLIQVL